jgi:hypothetical protein
MRSKSKLVLRIIVKFVETICYKVKVKVKVNSF